MQSALVVLFTMQPAMLDSSVNIVARTFNRDKYGSDCSKKTFGRLFLILFYNVSYMYTKACHVSAVVVFNGYNLHMIRQHYEFN